MARDCQIWKQVRKLNNDYLNLTQKIGVRLSHNLNNGTAMLNSPIAFAVDPSNGQKYLANFYQRTGLISDELQYEGYLPIVYEEPTDSNNGIANVRNLAFDPESSRVALVSQTSNLVRIYDKTQEAPPLAQIGEYNIEGNVVDGQLNKPYDCVFLPGGNLLIASSRGRGATSNFNQGHVTEYDSEGNLVATRLEYRKDGVAKIGSNICSNPKRIRLDPSDSNYLWISDNTGVLKFNLTTGVTEDMIQTPTGIDGGSRQSFCFLSDGNMAIADQELGGIYILNPETKELVTAIDVRRYGGTDQVRDVIEIAPGLLAVTCWASMTRNRVVVGVPVNEIISIAYSPLEIPDNYEIASDLLPNFYNQDTGSCEVPFDCLGLAKDFLAIPLRKICN
ncbi:MAG: hypothetical protein AAGA80_12640 [Cyanobacteria bacterium P01_F01_bin.143]